MKKLSIIGNLGKDPETSLDKNNNQFTTFSVAVRAGTKEVPKTDWFDVSCSYKLADVAKSYLKKGSKVYVDGNIIVSAYINKDGLAVPSVRLYANNLEFLDSKSDRDSNYSPTTSNNDNHLDNKASNHLTHDDIPF